MRLIAVAALLAALPWSASAAPVWQTVSAEPGKRIELDRTSIKREDGGKVLATGRIVLEREIPDAKTGAGYRVIEATTRYDCASRNGATIRRVFKKNEADVLRDEEQRPVELPVRSGTLDDKVLREVCRPSKDDAKTVADKASEAGSQLKAANEALVKAEAAKPAMPRKLLTKVDERPLLARSEMPAVQPHPAKRAKADRYVREIPVEPVHQHAAIHWSYEGEGGPDNWAKLDPKNTVCASGQRQSPIDIREGIKVDLEPIQFDYKPSYFRIVDNGHTVQVALGDGRITLTGKTYELIQFHFHKPAEERINGRGFDMVAHLVHRADDGQLAVVAVLMEKGSENPFIQTLWNYLPLEKNMEVSPPSPAVDLNTFLPTSRGYYTYMGSLTTPPCTEGVLWLVLRQPVQVSPEQIGIFSRLYRNNARPIQSAWGRLIKENR
ncbi:MAG TPA: carbonic anhydrase family protein [Rhodocyclaceae bacterium]|nr:carbonic anhydrase family protein [Rhodocyclaceae bacterium]